MTAKRDLPIEAASVNLGPCDFCPAIHINLLDAEGTVFATASLPVELAEEFITRMRSCAQELTLRHAAPQRRQ